MLQTVQPIWLFAMGAVVLPVIIHLWNDRQGKTMPVGSVVFLEKSSRRQARSPRISEWVLLLLRCLLLLLLALLLAGPFWRRAADPAAKGWVLVGDTTVWGGGAAGSNTGSPFGGMIDSLVRAGYVRKEMRLGAGTGIGKDLNWWKAFSALDRQEATGLPFYIFTDGRAVHFQGPRPGTERVVHWYTVADTGAMVKRRVAGAWRSAGGKRDSVEVMTLESGATGSLYTYQKVGSGDVVREVQVDTSSLRVLICADDQYKNDAKYVAAAIKALRQLTQRNIRLTVTGTGGPEKADWIFWLSEQALPRGMAGHVLQYQPGRAIPVESRVAGSDVPLMRMVGRDGKDTGIAPREAVWVDGFGRPLLSGEQTPEGRDYHFYSRFDPGWNGLVWSGQFPSMLEALLYGGKPFVPPGDDWRVLDPEQVLPRKGGERGADLLMGAGEKVKEEGGVSDLAPVCWILILLLFITERMMAYQPIKNKQNG